MTLRQALYPAWLETKTTYCRNAIKFHYRQVTPLRLCLFALNCVFIRIVPYYIIQTERFELLWTTIKRSQYSRTRQSNTTVNLIQYRKPKRGDENGLHLTGNLAAITGCGCNCRLISASPKKIAYEQPRAKVLAFPPYAGDLVLLFIISCLKT